MARPLRNLWRDRVQVRRRHRTWVQAMVIASFGWGVWWVLFLWWSVAPESAPSITVGRWLTLPFATLGIVLSVWGFRAKSSWLLLLAVPLLASVALALAPLVFEGVARAQSQALGLR